MLTPSAMQFISPLTFTSLSGAPAAVDMFEPASNDIEHIELAKWSDLIVIAPATATTLAKCAHGLADNVVTATVLATRNPVVFVPAMNTGMWENQATIENIITLRRFGNYVVEPEFGAMATRLEGQGAGRLPETQTIVENIFQFICPDSSLKEVPVTITAGRTIEKIDPVRFISNHSTGRMGFALANVAAAMGANVKLIHGPTNIPCPANVEAIAVDSAHEMFEKCREAYPVNGILIGAAAVSDYRPKKFSKTKIKKTKIGPSLDLEKNPDILFELKQQKNREIHIGFALETDDLLTNARIKLESKNLDFIVANSLADAGAGFAAKTNKVKLLFPDDVLVDLPLQDKTDVAIEIMKQASKLLNNKRSSG